MEIILTFIMISLIFPNPAHAISTPPFSIEFGKTEIVDHSSSRSSCPTYYDNTTRAFINNSGQVIYTGTDHTNKYALGDNLSEFSPQCASLLQSDHDDDPLRFNDSEYLMSPYTIDGTKIYGILHTEYHGFEHANCPCSESDSACRMSCYQYSLNLATSLDGGKNFIHADPPAHNIVHTSIPYAPKANLPGENFGFSSVSNLLTKEGYYYALLSAYTKSSPSDYGICAMRTNNLSDPKSWQFWNGASFSLSSSAQGGANPRCSNLPGSVSSITSSMTLLYNEYLNSYLSLGNDWGGNNPSVPEARISLSNNITNWTGPYLFSSPTQTEYYAYGTLIQPGDPSRNFERVGRSPWFYYVTCENGARTNYCFDDPEKTKLMRTRVRFTKPGDENKYELLNLQFNEYRGNKTLDSSFYINDGSLSGAAQFQTSSPSNILHFEKGGYVRIAQSPSLNLSNDFSLKFRLRTSQQPGSAEFPTIFNKSEQSNRNYALNLTPEGKVSFSFSSNGQYPSFVSQKKLNDGEWHDVTIIYKTNPKSITLLVDGIVSTTNSFVGKPSDGSNQGGLVIGSDWVGDLDYLILYNYPITTPNSPPISLPGDLDKSGKVDGSDYNLLKTNFGRPYTLLDYNLIATNFGK